MRTTLLISMLALAAASQAQVLNGGFESGSLIPFWSSIGNVSASTVDPYAGAYNAFLVSEDFSQGDIEGFLGLASGALGSGFTNGSAMKQSFNAVAGQTVSFAYKFTAGDYLPYNDSAFTAILNGTVVKLSDVTQVGDYGTTGWKTYSFVVNTTGTQTLGFTVLNSGDDAQDSTLQVDNVRVASVPGPLAALPFALGLLRRRRSV